MNLSVLQNFNPDLHLKTDPFPYIHIPEVLPWDLYERLEAEYPEQHITKMQEGGFGTARYCQHEFDYNHVTPLWRDFAAYHSSKQYKDEVVRAFRKPMTDLYPKGRFAEDLYTKYIRSDVSPRRNPVGATVRMEMQFVVNAKDHIQIRTPHVDQSKELFACLFYFKNPQDTKEDGGLNIYRNTAGKQWRRVTGREAVAEDIEVVDHIPYKRNTMACFLNSVNSLHRVTPRENPTHHRRYVNIDGHVVEKLFKFIDT